MISDFKPTLTEEEKAYARALMLALELSRTWAMPLTVMVSIALLRKPLSELLPTLASLNYKDQQRELHATAMQNLFKFAQLIPKQVTAQMLIEIIQRGDVRIREQG